MKRNCLIVFFVFLWFGVSSLHAQRTTEVSGKVLDADKLPIPGVNVVIKGTSIGTITDLNGLYNLTVPDPEQSVLVFSFIGFDTQEIKVGNKTVIHVVLASTAISLEEVVAIGYGTAKRKDLTGSVSSIKAGDVEKVPVANIAQALSGKVAGVQVNQASGSPDADIRILVRGGTSITQSNEPLYIIDGFPTEDGLKGIDPSDIESIDVLKDASSTAIFGARGANGVIVVTTKKGKEGKTLVNYDMYYGFKQLNNKMDVLNPYEFALLEYERATKSADELLKFNTTYGEFSLIKENYLNRSGIDWQDEVFDGRNPKTQMHKLSVSGGSKGMNYAASFTRNDDDGIMEGSGLERNGVRLKLDYKANDKLKTTYNVSYTDEKTKGMGSLSDQGYFSRMQHIIQYRPTIGLGNDQDLLTSDIDPLLQDDSGNTMVNPIASIEGEQREKRNRYLTLNGGLEYKLLPSLIYNGSIGYRTRDYNMNEFYTMRSLQGKREGAPYGTKTINRYETVTYNNTLTYKYEKNRNHRFDGMVGMEYFNQKIDFVSLGSKGFPEENFGLNDMSLGVDPMINSTYVYPGETMISFFGRLNYQLKNRYLFTATFRADGSSKFGANNKWGYFPSGSFAWRASEEPFIQNLNLFSNLKFRLSYGSAGNNQIGNFMSLPLMTSDWTAVNDMMVISYRNARLANPNLKWETNVTQNIGMDAGFFRNRLEVTFDYYRNTTKDLLLAAQLPFISGHATTMKNVGKTKNNGVEMSITSRNIETKDFSWTTTVNLAANKNEVVDLYKSDFFLAKSGWATVSEFNSADYIIKEGRSLGQMWGYTSDGIYGVDDFDFANNVYTLKEGVPVDKNSVAQPGSWKYRDISGPNGQPDGIIDSNDMSIIGDANPTLFGGINNQFNYKGFDLNVFLNFSLGADVYNANNMYYSKMSNRYKNVIGGAANRFTYIDESGVNIKNDPAALTALNQGKDFASVSGSSSLIFSSRYVEDGSFLRLNNISLGYTLPKSLVEKVKIGNLRVYATVYNLKTWTNYSGFDPEVNTKPNGNLTPGIDWGAYPRNMSFVFGLNLSL